MLNCLAYGYDVDYLRVPVTDEKAPKETDFELLIKRCWAPPDGAALVFNCQVSRGFICFLRTLLNTDCIIFVWKDGGAVVSIQIQFSL